MGIDKMEWISIFFKREKLLLKFVLWKKNTELCLVAHCYTFTSKVFTSVPRQI